MGTTNNAALGYALKAMVLSDLSREAVGEVLNEMKYVMDLLSEEEAARIYEKSEF